MTGSQRRPSQDHGRNPQEVSQGIPVPGNLLIIIILLFILAGCRPKNSLQLITEHGLTQGTTYTIKYYGETKELSITRGIDSIFRLINHTASVYDSTSIISRFNRNEAVSQNDHFLILLQESERINQISGGAFDITVGPLIKAWGFRKKEGSMLDSVAVKALLRHTGHQLLQTSRDTIIKLDPKVQIDLNAIAQGYTVDLVAGFLKSQKRDQFMVEIGGEVYTGSGKPDGSPWIIGIEKPAASNTSPQVIQQKIALTDHAIVTSGNYRNYFLKEGKKYTHVIDPRTGFPENNNILSVSVIAPNCMMADALATSMMVMGTPAAISLAEKLQDVEVYIIHMGPDNTMITSYSSGFEKFFTDN